jgi:hypothetical protein
MRPRHGSQVDPFAAFGGNADFTAIATVKANVGFSVSTTEIAPLAAASFA